MIVYVPNCYSDLFDDNCVAKRHVALTGRSSGKTEAFARKVYEHCDKYKESFIVVRDKTTYLKSTIWRTMKRVAKDMGIDGEYKFPESQPLRIINKRYGYTIDLYGIEDDTQKLKGYEGEGKNLCGIWFEEFGNISSPEKISEVEETVARSMSNYAVWLYSGNPPKEANAWSRAWINKIRGMEDFRVYDTTFADIWDLLSEQNKANIRYMYLTDPNKFEFVYLGKPSNSEGVVYSNFNKDRYAITLKHKLDDMIIAWAMGVDVAVDRDKTAIVLELKLANGRIITWDMKVHDPKDKNMPKLTINQQAELITKWYEVICKGLVVNGVNVRMSAFPHAIVVDKTDFGLVEELRLKNLPAVKVDRKDIYQDIERGKTLINCNRMYFIEENCRPLFIEFENLLYRNSVKTMNIHVDKYGTITRQQHVLGEDDIENAWRYAHNWLLMGDYQTYVLPPLKEYDEIKEINVMNLTSIYSRKGVVRNV